METCWAREVPRMWGGLMCDRPGDIGEGEKNI